MGRLLLVALSGVLAGCMFLDVKEQQEKLGVACTIKGTARSVQSPDRPIVAVLLQGRQPGEQTYGSWRVVSNFVLERAGRFVFSVPSGEGSYTVGAFDNVDGDLALATEEAFVTEKDVVTCTPGAVIDGFVLNVPAKPDGRGTRLSIVGLHSTSLDEQVSSVFGQQVAVGELTSLVEDMFSEEVAESGLWRPFDFLVNGYAGVYFLEPYDPNRVPVLFVHGINGTPASFKYLIEQLDHRRFQAWIYYYPSGLNLATIAEQLNQTVTKLQVRYRVPRFGVVAHSMGGLVSRGFIQRHQRSRNAADIPIYVTISTPWGGHKAAESGVKTAPVVVEVWRDMVPGSAYQQSLFAKPLPPEMQHHMLFTYQRKSSSFGESDDQGVSVASQLAAQAQSGAVRVYGFDDTHVGILSNPEVSRLLNELLEKSLPPRSFLD